MERVLRGKGATGGIACVLGGVEIRLGLLTRGPAQQQMESIRENSQQVPTGQPTNQPTNQGGSGQSLLLQPLVIHSRWSRSKINKKLQG